MTTAEQRAVLAPDPALPDRDLLLDADFAGALVARHLRRPGGAPIDACRRIKAKYRIGESLRVLYRVEAGGSAQFVAARMFPAGRAALVYGEARHHVVSAGPLRPLACDDAHGIVLWAFPNDRRIRHLPRLLQPGPEFDAVLGGPWHGTRVVAYAPERAATGQCLGPAGEVLGFAKVYSGDEGARSQALHDRLTGAVGADEVLQVPRALAYSQGHRLLLVQALAGSPVGEVAPAARIEAYRKLGLALARLHSLPVNLPERFRRLEPARLLQAAALVARARPELAAASDRLGQALLARQGREREAPVCLHGDVNSRNWLLQERRVALIDLDQMAMGPAAADLGGALAGLMYRDIIEEWTPAEVGALRQALLAGYQTVRPLPSHDSLRWHTAAALLAERALRAVTRFRVAGLWHLEALLTAALSHLEESTDV